MALPFCHQISLIWKQKNRGQGRAYSGLASHDPGGKLKTMNKTKTTLAIIITFFSLNSFAGLLYNYSQLSLKDLDQMNDLVTKKVNESKKASSGKTVPLKEALQAVYSRPNDDDMIDKVVAPLRSQLDELDAWEKTVSQLTDEAISVLNHPNAFSPVVQVTYEIFLENLLAEMKPYIATSNFEKTLTTRIRDAKIEISKKAINERVARSMKSTVSPSEIAAQILSAPVPPPAASPAPETSTETPASGK